MMFVGLGKTLFNSSVCLIEETDSELDIEMVLSERLLRQKASGVWPERALRELEPRWQDGDIQIAENRDVISPLQRENVLDSALPFFDHLKHENLAKFSRHFNPELRFVTHHRCHAMAAAIMSPFEKCLIVVIDGAGSAYEDFSDQEVMSELSTSTGGLGGVTGINGNHEECTVYLMDHGKLKPVLKRWRRFESGRTALKKTFSEGAGIFYESVAEYIFNSGRSAGKVMGLAPFGKPRAFDSRIELLNHLNWKDAFSGKGKADWDTSGRFSEFADLAATSQESFEKDLMDVMTLARSQFPDYKSVILTGGCALNCTFNAKLLSSRLFSEIYVPPFPGDESIGLGAASFLLSRSGAKWKRKPHDEQGAYFGSKRSVPTDTSILKMFDGFIIEKPSSIAERTADALAGGEIVAWFQGRSESGPRALGNRSILASPLIPNLKERLNTHIKFREEFRPYGCSCLFENAFEYFEVDQDFENPYMSFAVKTRNCERQRLSQVTHVDGTSRMQTVRQGQNQLFHDLIKGFGARTGLFCLLNTSLNVMGEPIVENVEDAKQFLTKTPVDSLAIGSFFIRRPESV